MLKPELLRKFISQHVPWLRENPNNLAVYICKGRIVSTGQRSVSFEYQYTMEVLAMDYPESLDTLSLPILAWARLYQPELILNPERAREGIIFEADILSDATMDVLIKIQASEAVVVKMEDGKPVIHHRADPMPEPELGDWTLIINDQVSGETWTSNPVER